MATTAKLLKLRGQAMQQAVDRALRENGHPLWRLGPPDGLPRRRDALATRYRLSREMVLVTSGVEQGLDLVARCLIEPGDTLVVHSDGVTEALRASGDMFGDQGLLEHLARSPGTTAAETVNGLLAAVRRYADGAPQSDDISLLAIRALP